MKTVSTRKQRSRAARAPHHRRRKAIAVRLSRDLREAESTRSLSVRKGDTVRIWRGSHTGEEGKVSFIDTRNGFLRIEGVTLTKADGKQVEYKIHHSNLLMIKGDLTSDRKRGAIIARRKEGTA